MQTVNAQSSLVIVSIKKEVLTFDPREPETDLQQKLPLLTLRSVQEIITSAKPQLG